MEPGSKGGTGETVKLWRENFNEPIIIDAMKVLESVSTEQTNKKYIGRLDQLFQFRLIQFYQEA